MSPLAPFALLLALLARPAAALSVPSPPVLQGQGLSVTLSVELGRAILVTDRGVMPLTRLRRVPTFQGAGHLEVAPGSRAKILWGGVGSLSVEGPASFSWQSGTDGEGVKLECSALHSANLEVRSFPLRLDLPSAWRATLRGGAYSFYALGGGGTEFVHHAGRRALVSYMGESGMVLDAIGVDAGQRFRMKGAPTLLDEPNDPSALAPAWGASTWPWGSGGIEGVPDIALEGARAWPDGNWPWGPEPVEVEAWERWDWPWSQPGVSNPRDEALDNGTQLPQEPAAQQDQVLPTAVPTETSSASTPRDSARGIESVPTVKPDPLPATLEPATTPEAREPAFDSSSWRGLEQKQVSRRREFGVQTGAGLHIDATKSGGWRLWVEEDAKHPFWYFSRRLDVRLFPGATLVIGSDGYLQYHTGVVRILSATEERSF